MERISEGNTNNYLIPGVLIVIAGIIFLLVGLNTAHIWLTILAALLFLIALSLFIGTNGIEIDVERKKYRKYGKFGPFVIGKWIELTQLNAVRIQVHSESHANEMFTAMPGRVASVNTKVLTYDLIVTNSRGESHIMYSFLKYKAAKTALQIVAEGFNVPSRDLIVERIAENRAKRR